MLISELGVFWHSRKRNDITHILHPGRIHDGAFEPQPKPRMWHRAVPAQVAIPVVRSLVELHLIHAAIEYIEPFFTLRPADNLADAGGEDIHRGDGFFVVVEPHVEG